MVRIFEANETSFEGSGVCILENAKEVRVHKAINGDWTLTFKIPCSDPKNKYITSRRIAVAEGQAYRIIKKVNQNSEYNTVEAVCAARVDAKSVRFRPDSWAPVEGKPYEILSGLFNDTAISVLSEGAASELGMEWAAEYIKITERPSDGLALIERVLENLPGTELYIDNYKVAVVKRIGSASTPYFYASRSLNLSRIAQSEDSSSLVNALWLYGANGIWVYKESSESIELYGRVCGEMAMPDVDDAGVLEERAEWLMSPDNPSRIDMPKISYEAELADLYKLDGTRRFNLGDSLKIKDSAMGIETIQRITEIEYYPFEAARGSVVLGAPPAKWRDVLKKMMKRSGV